MGVRTMRAVTPPDSFESLLHPARPTARPTGRARLGAAALLLSCAAAGPLLAQTPTPTATATPTPTPAAGTFARASTQNYGFSNGLSYDGPNLVLDPDGSIWVASATENVIAKISPDGRQATRWTMPKDTAPQSLLREPDGTFWITELGGFKIGKFDPAAGTLTEWADFSRRPTALVKRADGKFWLPETSGALALFDPAAGSFTYFTSVSNFSLSYPYLDADGSLWTCDFVLGAILRFTPDGTKATRWPLPALGARPSKVFRGPDGALWISLYLAGQLGRFVPETNELKLYSVGAASPFDLASYRGRIAYTEQFSGSIGFLDPATATPTDTKTLTPTELTMTVSPVRTSSPTVANVTSKTDDIQGTPASESVGISVSGVTVYPTGIGPAFGMLIDEPRARIFFGTNGNVGTLRPPIPLTASDHYYPAVASISGQNGAVWKTQLVTWNRGRTPTATPTPTVSPTPVPILYEERLLPNGWIAGFSPASSPVVDPNRMRVKDDPIGTEMQGPNSFGALRLTAINNASDFYSWARVYRQREDGGTYGFARNPVTAAEALAAGETGFLFSPPTTDQRTNAGYLVVEAAKGTLAIVDADGAERFKAAFDWPSGWHVQASTIFSTAGLPRLASARVVFSVESGKLLPFGTSIDDVTNDPVDLHVFRPLRSSTIHWIPGVMRHAGPLGLSSATDLQLFNPGGAPAMVSVFLSPARELSSTGPSAGSPVAFTTVPAGRVVTLRDVFASLLGVETAIGALAVVSDAPIHVFARVTAPADGGGAYGFGLRGLLGDEVVPKDGAGVFLCVTDNGWDVMQSDLHVTNPFDEPVSFQIRLTDVSGAAAGTRDVTLAPKESRYLESAWYSLAGFGVDIGRMDLVPNAGSLGVFATLVRWDKKTRDADAIVAMPLR